MSPLTATSTASISCSVVLILVVLVCWKRLLDDVDEAVSQLLTLSLADIARSHAEAEAETSRENLDQIGKRKLVIAAVVDVDVGLGVGFPMELRAPLRSAIGIHLHDVALVRLLFVSVFILVSVLELDMLAQTEPLVANGWWLVATDGVSTFQGTNSERMWLERKRHLHHHLHISFAVPLSFVEKIKGSAESEMSTVQ
jgi:hypothetical protein